MANIGSLVVDLLLKSAQFNADLAKSSAAVARSSSAMQRSLARVETGFVGMARAAKTLAVAAVVTQTARAFTNLAKSAIEAGDEVGATATKLGMGVEQLQRLRFAASQADVDIGTLDTALKMFQKNVATGKAPAIAFEDLIAKIAEAGTQTEKVALAAPYFGKQYQAALSIAAEGADKFKRNMEQASIISSKAARVASDLDNKFRAVGNAIQAGFQTGFLESFSEGLAGSEGRLKDLNRAAMTFGQAMGVLATKTAQLVDKIAKFISDHPGLTKLLLNPDPTFGALEGGLSRDTSVGLGKGTVVGQGVLNTKALAAATGAGGRGFTGAGIINDQGVNARIAKEAADAAAADAEAAERIAGAKKAAADAQKSLNDQQQLYKTLLEGSRTPQEQYRAALDQITESGARGELQSRLQTMATATLANEYLGLASTAAGALGTLFKDSKAVAVAQAVINTAQAITATLAQYGATPWGLAASAVAAASGAAQIATIMSAQPGSGKKPAVGASGKAAKTKEGGSGGGQTMKQAVSINLMGSGGFTRDQVRQLAQQLNGLVADGATIAVN